MNRPVWESPDIDVTAPFDAEDMIKGLADLETNQVFISFEWKEEHCRSRNGG